LNSQQVAKLNRIIGIAQNLIAASKEDRSDRLAGKSRRIRRTGQELVKFRRLLKAERKKGVPVAELARRHGISSAYIYMLP
jgi:hypothetical protein